jgi:hypothetical protein
VDMSELVVPEWICTLVGRLVLDNEALRQQIAPPPPTNGHAPVEGFVDVEVESP